MESYTPTELAWAENTAKSVDGNSKKVTALNWSASGSTLAAAFTDSIGLINFDNGSEPRVNIVSRASVGNVTALSWNSHSSDNNMIALASSDKNVRIFDVRSAASNSISIDKTILSVNWHPNDNVVVLGTRDDHLICVDTRKNAIISSHPFEYELNDIAFHPRSQHLYASLGNKRDPISAGMLGVYKFEAPYLSAPEELVRIRVHKSETYILKMSNCGKHLLTGAESVTIWDSVDLTPQCTLARGDSRPKNAIFSKDAQHIAVSYGDKNSLHKTLEICRIDGTRVRNSAFSDTVTCMAFSPSPSLNILAYSLDSKSGNVKDAGKVYYLSA